MLSAWLAAPALAEDLKDIIPGLYGGDGIRLATPANMHDPQFTNPDGGEFEAIGSAIAAGVNLFTVGSVVSSFTFDPQQAVFVRSNEGLGSMVAEQADTIGKGNINFGMSYTRFNYKSFEGEDLNSLDVNFDHVDLCPRGLGPGVTGQLPSIDNNFCSGLQPSPNDPPFEVDGLSAVLNVELTQEIVAFFASYGILDNWDVGLVIPVVHTDMSAESRATINRNFPGSEDAHQFCTSLTLAGGARPGCEDGTRDLAVDSNYGDAWGIGDVELRSKFQFLNDHEWAPDAAILGRVRFETGDEDDFLGAGFTAFSLALLASKTIWIFTPHVNAGFEVTTGSSNFDNFRWVAGSTAKLHDRVTLGTDFLGRHSLDPNGIGDNILEFAVSMKVNPFSSFNVVGSAIFPLNYNEGLRTAVTWTLGAEYTF